MRSLLSGAARSLVVTSSCDFCTIADITLIVVVIRVVVVGVLVFLFVCLRRMLVSPSMMIMMMIFIFIPFSMLAQTFLLLLS